MSITAQELRPNCIIKFDDTSEDIVKVKWVYWEYQTAHWLVSWEKISGNGHFTEGESILEDFEGMPLSSDILLACGFVKKKGWELIGLADPQEEQFDKWDDLTLTKLTKGKFPNADGHHYYYLGGRPTTRVTYLHELQNLFWCLHGKEIEYQPK